MNRVVNRMGIASLVVIGCVFALALAGGSAYADSAFKYGNWFSTTQGSATYASRSALQANGRIVDAGQEVKTTQGNMSKGYVNCNARLFKASTGAVVCSSGFKTNTSAKLVNKTFRALTTNFASKKKMAAKTAYYSKGQTQVYNNLTKKWYGWVTPQSASYTTTK